MAHSEQVDGEFIGEVEGANLVVKLEKCFFVFLHCEHLLPQSSSHFFVYFGFVEGSKIYALLGASRGGWGVQALPETLN